MSIIDDLNYAQDPRTQGRIENPVIELESGDEIELPWRWEVCPVCDGKGTHVNPSIDAGGINYETFGDDPDFAEDYRQGVFDQTCNGCGGRSTVPVIDEPKCAKEDLAAYHNKLDADADYRAECLAEMRMGA